MKEDYTEKLKVKNEELEKRLQNSFCVSDKEWKRIKKWQKTHEKACAASESGAIGGRYSYIFLPTSIGIIGTVKCVCGKEFCFKELE